MDSLREAFSSKFIFEKEEIDMQSIYNKIADIGQSLHADKIVLYGSRARGDSRERSDIDIAVYGMPASNQHQFWSELEELPTLLDFDVVFVDEATSPALLENINKDGIILMNKMQEKYTKLKDAVTRLNEALQEYKTHSSDVVRDGVIQRFEFCTELAWKTTREYLIDQGYTEINSPKAVMKQAYADGIITDESTWLALLTDRNITSHIYDDATAAGVFNRIDSQYISLFTTLVTTLSK